VYCLRRAGAQRIELVRATAKAFPETFAVPIARPERRKPTGMLDDY